MMSFAPEHETVAKPEALLRVPIGFASPLWGLFAGAAVSGAAWWWMTRWTRPQNLEAMLAATPEVETVSGPVIAALAAPAVEAAEAVQPMIDAVVEEVVEPVIETVAETVLEPVVELVAETAPEPVAEPIAEVLGEVPAVAEDIVEAVATEPMVAAEVVADVAAATPAPLKVKKAKAAALKAD